MTCHPDLLDELRFHLQGDGKRELEYRAGEEQPQDSKEEAGQEQQQRAAPEAPSKQPEAEPAGDDQGAAEDEEGPTNEQGQEGDVPQKQDFTSPEACTRPSETRDQVAILTALHGKQYIHCEEQGRDLLLDIRPRLLWTSTHVSCSAGTEKPGSAIGAGPTARA